ncbi:MAG: hypothetical protein L0287_38360 [Anaerolineae bacterium]|nr:hypothetical protein [Anaerolineae bacterium]MCI0608900.1 hypothetical protein [Anaerolineae bacterium]
MSTFEDQYLDVLQNIEMAIVSVYREHKDLLDYDVDKVLNLLWTEYRHEQQGRATPAPRLGENAQLVYDRVKDMCEFRLGRSSNVKTKGWFKAKPTPISVAEIMDCLKRIRKSVNLWNKEGGRQGYLYFIDNNID